MKHLIKITILLLFTSAYVFGQTQDLILTKEQNNDWLDNLKTLPLEQQLFTLKNRLLSDTSVFIRQSYPDRRIPVDEQLGTRVHGDAKPVIVIGNYPIIIDNKTETSKIIGLTNLLSGKYISIIHVLSPNDPTTAALYGSASLGGVIIMKLTRKKILKAFKKLALTHNY